MTRRAERAAAALAAAAACVPFLPALNAGFLDWDDKANLVANSAYAGLAPANLRWMLTSRHLGPWQPLSWLSYAADRALWGLDAGAFRRTNLCLHALAAALCLLVAKRLLDAALPRAKDSARLLGALAAALCFAVHPLRVESVVWVTERRDVLSGALLLGAWLARLEDFPAAALILYAGALMSKGTAVALPVFLLAAEKRPFSRAALRGAAPYFALAAAAAVMNLIGFGTGDFRTPSLPPGARLAIAAHSAGFYLVKTLFPFGLSPYYPLPHVWASAVPSLIGYAAIAAAVTAAVWKRPLAPAWLAYLLALAPTSGLLQNGAQLAADRYSYLPCLPFAFVAGGAAALLAARRPRAAAAAVAAAAVALSALAWRQAGFWRSDAALWTRAVELAPEAPLPLTNLATALLKDGDRAGALALCPRVLRAAPRDVGALVNCGVLIEERGGFDQAERLFRAALAVDPEDGPARFDLDALLKRKGE